VAVTQLIVHAVVEAVTEVFPIGAAGHTALMSHFLIAAPPNRALALAIRAGMLLAVLIYFWRDVGDMIGGVIRAAKGKRDPGAKLALQIFVAAILTLGLGFAFEQYAAGAWETPIVMGWCIVGFGALMLLLDRMSMTVNRIEHTSYGDAIAISAAQVLGLIPGVGATAASMIMARVLGYERAHAARLALLLAIPVWIAVLVRDAYMLIEVEGRMPMTPDMIAGGVAFAAAFIAIAILMNWLRRATFTPFLAYRLLLGTAVLVLAYNLVAL
jgi:undecaprenyl-diphosphatase